MISRSAEDHHATEAGHTGSRRYSQQHRQKERMPREAKATIVMLALWVAVIASVGWWASTDDSEPPPTPAERCAESGGRYIGHGPSVFHPRWSCEYPAGVTPD